MAKRKTGTTYAAVEKMLLGWPGVELSTSYGRPSLKIKGKFYTWVKEDGDSIVIGGIGFDERDVLMETQGDVFYITDHYRNSRYVLMRLSKADPAIVAAYLRRRWFEIAPKKLHTAFGETRPIAEPRRAAKRAPAKKVSKAQPRGRRGVGAT
jgi:hypothetical protein